MTTVERKSPPRDNVCRSMPFTLTRDGDGDEDGDGRSFAGYGAVFNSITRIDSWEGTFDEQLAPGAFRKSLRERTPKFQFDHGHHPLIGSVPIGVISDIHEDDRGLYVEARLGEHILIDLIREAIATGAIDGMSFRFSVVREEWRDAEGKIVKPEDVDEALWTGLRGNLLRTLKEVKIAEVGPVVWPAYSDTTAGVRSAGGVVEIDPNRLQEPEQRRLLGELLLRADAAGSAPERGESDEEPQDTPDGAVEHSEQDDGTPRDTSKEATTNALVTAGFTPESVARAVDANDMNLLVHSSRAEADEHEPNPVTEDPAPTDDVDAARAAATERLFTEALNAVKNTREATPPMSIEGGL